MSVRALDVDGNWLYGIGRSAYIKQNAEVAQNIATRLRCFLGDCFFDQGAGIDWFNELGGKDQIKLNLDISATILNTRYVTGIRQLSVNLDHNTRQFLVTYTVQTSYSVFSGSFQYDLGGTV